MFKKFYHKHKQNLIQIIKIETSPNLIALGFAIGTFIGILPTPGISIFLALLVILIYGKVNKVALFGGILVWNPLLTVPLNTLSYKIGELIFGNVTVVKYKVVIFNQIYNFSKKFLIGNLILAILISVISYFLVWLLAYWYFRKKKEKVDSVKITTK